ncbi:MAG: DEAD/DEAH box helicase, partial [Candidatus Micrarchaeia archaeon]
SLRSNAVKHHFFILWLRKISMPTSILTKRFGSLTEVQKQAVPLVYSGANVIIIAPTGSGKTESAAIPVLKKISEQGLKGIAALYITPLRALNRDMPGT